MYVCTGEDKISSLLRAYQLTDAYSYMIMRLDDINTTPIAITTHLPIV